MLFFVEPRIINAIATHCAKKDVRPYLNGIHAYTSGGTVVLEATDGHKLIQHKISADVTEDFDVVFMPPKLAMKGQVRFEVIDGSVSLYQNNTVHTPEIVNMPFPDTNGVIPTDCNGEQAAFNPTLMQAALKAIDEIGKAEGYRNKPTRVHFNGNAGMRVDCKMLPDTVAVVMPLRE